MIHSNQQDTKNSSDDVERIRNNNTKIMTEVTADIMAKNDRKQRSNQFLY